MAPPPRGTAPPTRPRSARIQKLAADPQNMAKQIATQAQLYYPNPLKARATPKTPRKKPPHKGAAGRVTKQKASPQQKKTKTKTTTANATARKKKPSAERA